MNISSANLMSTVQKVCSFILPYSPSSLCHYCVDLMYSLLFQVNLNDFLHFWHFFQGQSVGNECCQCCLSGNVLVSQFLKYSFAEYRIVGSQFWFFFFSFILRMCHPPSFYSPWLLLRSQLLFLLRFPCTQWLALLSLLLAFSLDLVLNNFTLIILLEFVELLSYAD